MVADLRVLTNHNIINHASMPFAIIATVHWRPIFFGSIASCTVLNFRPINTSAENFSPNAGCGVNLYPSRKFCSTSSIVPSPFAFL
ncbi:unnamed protein product [Hymenolepis diminuta]|uniref:Uncharacterized protein n=1 Tax=Hymenolepis diminuta TaxID=6216 RepID=A0A564YFG2_HYMDI|nr:unnamed protein product [Hymenolepis diminuta]